MQNLAQQKIKISHTATQLKWALNISEHPAVLFMLGFPEAPDTHTALCMWLVDYQFNYTLQTPDLGALKIELEKHLIEREYEVVNSWRGGVL
jgi:hypothetical protein